PRPAPPATPDSQVAALHSRQPLRIWNFAIAVVACRLLGIHLDTRVGRDQLVRELDALADFDGRSDDRVVLEVAHRHQPVDTPNAQPVQNVRHQFLEAHVLHAGDAFGAQEIVVRAVAALLPLARVVDQELGHLAQGAAFLAGVDDQTYSALLRAADAFLDRMRKVRPAGADIGPKDVRAVALVVHASGQRD